MGLLDDLAIILSGYSGGYRHIRRMINGYRKERYPSDSWRVEEESVHVALSRLKKKGFVEKRGGMWRSTKKGKRFAARLDRLPHHSKKFGPKKGLPNIIIAFDIPEAKRKQRNWLREELKCLGFAKLQQSVWLGRGPLPGTFIEKLKALGLFACVKFFHVAKKDII